MGARILSGATATGAGPTIKSGAMNHAVLVSFANTTGSVTVLHFKFQGRIASGGWVDLTDAINGLTESVFSAGELTAKAGYRFFKEQPVDDIRVNITTLTQTGQGADAAVAADYKSEKN